MSRPYTNSMTPEGYKKFLESLGPGVTFRVKRGRAVVLLDRPEDTGMVPPLDPNTGRWELSTERLFVRSTRGLTVKLESRLLAHNLGNQWVDYGWGLFRVSTSDGRTGYIGSMAFSAMVEIE